MCKHNICWQHKAALTRRRKILMEVPKLETSLLCRLQAQTLPDALGKIPTLMPFEIYNLIKLPNIVYFMSGSTSFKP